MVDLFKFVLHSIRSKVSFPRTRFYDEKNGVSLDLSYITDRIIVMAAPTLLFPKRIYRNNLKDVLRFLEQRHSENWDFLFKVFHYPFPDHEPPPFRIIPEILDSMSKYMNAFDDNVVVLHCKAGKGRSGTIACSYLISEEKLTAESALSKFTEARIQKGHSSGITILSQKRYIFYVEKWVSMGKRYEELDIIISQIEVFSDNKKIGCKIYGYNDDNRIECLYAFLPPEIVVNDSTIVFTPTIKFISREDICVEIYRQSRFKKNVLKAHCWFNVFFERDADQTEDIHSLTSDNKYIKDSLITESMEKEEMNMIRSSINLSQKEQEKKAPEIVMDDKGIDRLKFLLEKSKIYTSILSEKLKKRVKDNEIQKKSISLEKKEIKSEFSDLDLLDRSEGSEMNEKDILVSKKNNVSVKKTANSKYGYGNRITDYFTMKVSETLCETEESYQSKDDFDITDKTLSLISQPKLITGCILRDYQFAGVEWLASLYENGLNGILADEMGLGKTLQTISFLAFLREKGTYGPFLIAAPLSTISNWVSEFKKFSPEIPVLLYHGSKQERSSLRKNKMGAMHPDFPIIVTSYEVVMNDKLYLKRYQWKYIVVDEGHRIKNLNCKLIRELKSYDSANRLLLTGTPLQNNLTELWSLLNFLLPDIFDDLDSFQSWFDFSALQDKKDEETLLKSMDVVSTLHCILKPFLLRRLKADVEQSVSKKREYVLYAPMTIYQNELYNAILNKDIRNFLMKRHSSDFTSDEALEVDNEELNIQRSCVSKSIKVNKRSLPRRNRSRISYSELINNQSYDSLDKWLCNGNEKKDKSLYKEDLVCNHPYMIDFHAYSDSDKLLIDENIVNMSGKMLLLQRLLPALFEDNHKVLIFSQFTKMLDIIELWAVNMQNWEICRIDGLTKQTEREKQIEDFYENLNIKLFLLSTRAGGLGINLTVADTVIIFDSDWNPQQDLQAQDRVHRIGQDKPVIVYRLVSANTVEEKILERANSKRCLEKLVIQKGKFKSLMSISSKDDDDELTSMLLFEDAKKIVVKGKDDEILSNEDLKSLLDRSDDAYKISEKKSTSSVNYRIVN
ncbi:hypothetical protein MERGE_000220 [Pneumocystis wakefieldiae]|uniref:Phosphatidylinositol-3,4,5-trisphosphate 3-phosphatase n=1 Tax=Pneumocystis wakefieldiae TaxID=38082 RepID=A0A899FUU9_9ASCO|nr:hypothetical protein MERGE_000220 [Pneumocystis wakefieldiae]